MNLVVGVRFADSGKLQYFDPADIELAEGDYVLADTKFGERLGQVVLAPREVADTGLVSGLRSILRKVEKEETVQRTERNPEREQEAMRICEEKIRRRGMPMKLIDAEFAADGSKLIFYFAADGRVDFRDLVRDLASVFRTRIELRQIGVRDEAKKIGGLGPCGRPCCCNQFLEDFTPVSIRMAKEQSLSLSPTKISGLCGRLMCCLHYEHEHYREMHKLLPKPGAFVETRDGTGEVADVDALMGKVRARMPLPDGNTELHTYELDEIITSFRAPRAKQTEAEEVPARGKRAVSQRPDRTVRPEQKARKMQRGKKRPLRQQENDSAPPAGDG